MPSKHRFSSSLRRLQQANQILRLGHAVMRPCAYCLSHHVLCVMSNSSEHCEQCVRHHRHCELTPPNLFELERLSKQERKLFREASEAKIQTAEAQAKAKRLALQRRLVIKRIKEI